MSDPIVTVPSTTSTETASAAPHKSIRLLSLDALRGFDMLWILGADFFVQSLDKVEKRGFMDVIAAQL